MVMPDRPGEGGAVGDLGFAVASDGLDSGAPDPGATTPGDPESDGTEPDTTDPGAIDPEAIDSGGTLTEDEPTPRDPSGAGYVVRSR